jgi:aminoglycoside phosphotransferase (APT) family kinase protein
MSTGGRYPGALRQNPAVTIAEGSRDADELRTGLARWLTESRGTEVSVGPLARPDAGLSTDTLFVDAGSASGEEELVVRLPPLGGGLFPEYRLEDQARVQQLLAGSPVPVAHPVEYVADTEWLGAPFMVMPKVPGRVLLANPSFVSRSWLKDAPASGQARLFDGFVAVLADLHRLDPEPFAFLGDGRTVADHLDRATAYLAWASDDVPPPSFMEEALDWCASHLPQREPERSLLWGDVQLVNAVFDDDLRVAAVLDWEMASLGPAELDVGWFFALHDMTAAQVGGDLPGFPKRPEALGRYERLLGRKLDELRWYEAFALLRSGSVMVRMARLLARRGVDARWLTTRNPVVAALDRVLG